MYIPARGALSTLFLLKKIFFKDFTYLFIYLFILEIGKGREKERERNINVWLPLISTGDLAFNPGMCPDWELNWQPFSLQASIQSTELHQPGLGSFSSHHSSTMCLSKRDASWLQGRR